MNRRMNDSKFPPLHPILGSFSHNLQFNIDAATHSTLYPATTKLTYTEHRHNPHAPYIKHSSTFLSVVRRSLGTPTSLLGFFEPIEPVRRRSCTAIAESQPVEDEWEVVRIEEE